MAFLDILKSAAKSGCADVYLFPGAAVRFRSGKSFTDADGGTQLKPDDVSGFVQEAYVMAERDMAILNRSDEDDFSISVPDLGRFRCGVYRQRNSLAMILRSVSFELPDAESHGIPESVMALSAVSKGLVLIAGPAGCGKTVTLTCLLDAVNSLREGRILTIENPVEYIHPHKKCLVTQREVGRDVRDYDTALKGALRRADDTVMVSELPGPVAIDMATRIAETGRLVLTSMTAMGTAGAIGDLVRSFPSADQPLVRMRLSMVLQAVVFQQLVPDGNNGLAAAFEVVTMDGRTRDLIRDGAYDELDQAVYSESGKGWTSMDRALLDLCRAGRISKDTALVHAMRPEIMRGKLAFV